MIPKIIHYCWLSNEPFPELIDNCIKSWKKKLIGYEFVLWDTKKFDVNSNLYVKQAYEAKKYAFASDYIRLYALYNYGGIYLDSDILIYKSFDELLNRKAFTGFENKHSIAAWILASQKGNPLFAELLSHYEHRSFLFPDGSYDMTPNVKPITKTLIKHGLKLNDEYQELDMISVFPRTYFCPMIPNSDEPDCYSENTYTQHMFNAGWIDLKQKALVVKRKKIDNKFGKHIGLLYYGFMVLKKDGIYSFLQQWKVRIEQQRGKRNDKL